MPHASTIPALIPDGPASAISELLFDLASLLVRILWIARRRVGSVARTSRAA